jgi:threonylcarbamoyladenosine tRNA methylthiotransferase MtaB
MRVAFSNLGCKLNQAELEDLAREFAGAGHQIVSSLQEAEVHVVNTCTVTEGAARDSRKTARRGRRQNPSLKTVLTGCYVAADPLAAAALAGVDLVVGNEDKERLVDRVIEAFPELAAEAAASDIPYMPLAFGNARGLVKVEDGCDMRCSFCIIPTTRGPQRSRDPRAVVAEVQQMAAAGFPEVLMTGVQISAYRAAGLGLYELTARLLAETTVPRLRLTSIAPWQFDHRLLDLFVGGRLCRHLHLSLQSGCDATLRRMRRPYSREEFAALVGQIRRRLPGVAITTDVIVGFPGETAEDFAASLAFVAAQDFSRLHAFPYSLRPGTTAAALPARVPPGEIKARMASMLSVARDSEARFARRQVGQMASVLWEGRRNGWWLGTSDNYVRVKMRSGGNLRRRLTRALLLDSVGPFAHAARGTG